jgi:hypothetical protein
MEIKNIANLSVLEVRSLVAQGAKFVVYSYCISLLVVTFKRPTAIYFIRPHESAVTPGLKYVAVSLILGWWGIPFGIIYTIGTTLTNLAGGKEITKEMMLALESPSVPQKAV